MTFSKFLQLSCFVLFALNRCAVAEDGAFQFLATGDLPYSASQETSYRQLLAQSATEDFEFMLHVGDFKGQSMPCSDGEFTKIRDLFRAYPKPIVYTPGDNEWTDCHGVGADPVERLEKIRELFFSDATVLRLDHLKTKHQSDDPAFAKYAENYRFTRSGVDFVVVHVVGSGNNYRTNEPSAMTEYEERNKANLAFLKESFDQAIASDATAVALIIHANPNFETGRGKGFADFRDAVKGFLEVYKKPVVCIHGDTHYYRIDKPIKNRASQTVMHFTRMEVFGSPTVGGVIVTVDPSDSQVFGFRPYLVTEP